MQCRAASITTYILVDTLQIPIARRVELATYQINGGAARLLAGLEPLFPSIRTILAAAGNESPYVRSSNPARGRLEARDRQTWATRIL
jgi:hypothetical protein